MRCTVLVALAFVLTIQLSACGRRLSLEDEYKVLESVQQRIERGYGKDEESELARRLRLVVLSNSLEHSLQAMMLLQDLRRGIWNEYADLRPEGTNTIDESVGVALSRAGRKDEALDVLIREAQMLSMPAELMLNIIYTYNVEGYRQRDPRILNLYEVLAKEGQPRAKMRLGELLLKGNGAPFDRRRALRLLEDAGFGDAYMVLANDAYERQDDERFEVYLRKAAEEKMPIALYNLGVLKQRYGEYGEAVSFFEQTLALDDDYHPARLELGRMYIEGWGVEQNPKKAVAMMKRVARDAEGELAAIAEYNLGNCYLRGFGVEKSETKALDHIKRSAAAGLPQAKVFLEGM